MKKHIYLILPIAALIAGCLGDTIDGPQVQPRPIFPPGQVYYRSITGTLNLEIRWNPPIVDTQNNFKGYFIELFNSTPYSTPQDAGIDSTLGSPIDSAHVLKSDTMYTFISKVIQGNRYTVKVWGERVPSKTNPDSLVLSQSPTSISFNYDSRPVLAPAMIGASSFGSTVVNLVWFKSPSEANVGMYGYVIRYKDTTRTNSPLITYSFRPPKDTSQSRKYYQLSITIPANSAPPVELPYKFWVKTIRKDSVESADSIGISWSGAELIPSGSIPVKLDTALFLGQVGFGYNMVQVDQADPKNAYLQITHSGSTILILSRNGTKFVNRVDRDTGLNFIRNFFPAPFKKSDFDQSQISFPAAGAKTEGAMIYALFPAGTIARILFQVDSTGSYFRQSDNTTQVQASFQPSIELPFF